MEALAGLPSGVKLIVPVAITVWLVAISVMDHRTGRIPNSWTAPVMFGVGLIRVAAALGGLVRGDLAASKSALFMLVAWVVLLLLWRLHFMGGGDSKFLMAQFALFPSMDFVAVLAFVLLIIEIPVLILELRGRKVGQVWFGLRDRLATGQVLPTAEELQERGRRHGWMYAVPAIIYTWIYWRELGGWF